MNSSTTPADTADALTDALAPLGLVVAGWRDTSTLPDDTWLGEATTGGSVLVVCNAGGGFWRKLKSGDSLGGPDPVDRGSLAETAAVLDRVLPVPRTALYPTAAGGRVNLLALLRTLDWQRPSPLGLGIHADYGLWHAVRAVWWLDCASPALAARTPAPDLCAACTSQACIQTCPASALTLGRLPDLRACADYRFSTGSRCASTCVARTACPVAPEHRYDAEQIAHHYDLATTAMVAYRGDSGA
ncbi:MAG: hypothetical protein AAF460_18080 [Pseudomonadota bacterium]